MTYLLDTNICIYIIKKKPEVVLNYLEKYELDELKISAISVAELMYGIEKSQRREENKDALLRFLASFEILSFDQSDAEFFGSIRQFLEAKGKIIGSYDMQIASQALSRNLTLVTNNEKEFLRVPNLRVENWVN